MNQWNMKIRDLDIFLEEVELASEYFLYQRDEDGQELVECSYIYLPQLNVNIHEGIYESYVGEGEYATDYDYYIFFDAETKGYLYSEQGSSLITCIHNYSELSWEEIEELECRYNGIETEG